MADYDRVLKQRNTLLKSARASRLRESQLGTLDIWDERLVALGSELVDARLGLVAKLTDPLVAAYRSVAGDDHHPRLLPLLTIRGAEVDEGDSAQDDTVTASSGYTTADTFRQAIAAARPKELDRGLTLVGPHRDDVLFELNGLPAKGYASHGESWSFALALKLAAAELLRRESSTGDPVLILDDVFAELDQARRRALASAVAGYEQVLITAAVYDDVPPELTAHTVRIEAGAVVEPDHA
jgi:DNA replication and repair protein RecF